MNYLKKLWVTYSLFFVIATPIYSQKGDYYITHYAPPTNVASNENVACVLDKFGNMFFANSKGVLKFDGKYWNLIRTGSTALHLQIDESENVLYVACLDGVGKLQMRNDGNFIYVPIFKQVNKFGYYSKVIVLNDKVYFQGAEELLEWDKSAQKVTQHITAKVDVAFKYQNQIFACFPDSTIHSLSGKKFIPLKLKLPDRVRFAKSIDNEQSLICTKNGKFFHFYGNSIKKIPFSDSVYISASVPFDALILNNENTLAIATLKGGCILTDFNTFTTTSIVNYYTGLPDDEVYAIGKDAQSGLWMAHEKGFSRLDYFLPFKNFTNYPGLEGHILAAITFFDKLYVGTNEGLFFLEKANDIQEIKKIARKKPKEKQSVALKTNTLQERKKEAAKSNSIFSIFKKKKDSNQDDEENDKDHRINTKEPVKPDTGKATKKKSFFSFLKRKNKDGANASTGELNDGKEANTTEENIKSVTTKENRNTINKPQNAAKTVLNTGSAAGDVGLLSLKYIYKRVNGIDAKCKQLLIYQNQLLAATNNGLYVVTGSNAVKLVSEAVTHAFLHKNSLYVGTEDNKLLMYEFNGQKWVLENTLFDLHEKIISFSADANNQVWCLFTYSIMRINTKADELDPLEVYNPYSDKIYLMPKNDTLYVVVDKQFYVYDATSNTLLADSSAAADYRFQKIISANGKNFWALHNGSWSNLGLHTTSHSNLIYLNLVKNIEGIQFESGSKRGWVITANNQLLAFDIEKVSPFAYSGNVYLQHVVDNNGNRLPLNDIKIDQESDNVQFTFITPEYLDIEAVEYQYLLAGLTKDWSNWDTENKISFSYLPAGKYTLLVRTKNSLNQIAESQPFTFVVKPPFWQEWWFYLGEFLFFGSLLAGAIYMNNSTHGEKYFWLSKGLTFLTIVMMIEFVNTVLESYFDVKDNPVLSFGVQVLLAILIFPFERILNKLITQTPKVTLPKPPKSGKKTAQTPT